MVKFQKQAFVRDGSWQKSNDKYSSLLILSFLMQITDNNVILFIASVILIKVSLPVMKIIFHII